MARTPSASGGSGGSAAGGSSNGGSAAAEPAEGGSAGSPDPVDSTVTDAQARAVALIDGLEDVRKVHDVPRRHLPRARDFTRTSRRTSTPASAPGAEEEIKTAIRDGKDKDGKALCKTMERYPFTDAQLSDLAIYLKHLPPITKKITREVPVTLAAAALGAARPLAARRPGRLGVAAHFPLWRAEQAPDTREPERAALA